MTDTPANAPAEPMGEVDRARRVLKWLNGLHEISADMPIDDIRLLANHASAPHRGLVEALEAWQHIFTPTEEGGRDPAAPGWGQAIDDALAKGRAALASRGGDEVERLRETVRTDVSRHVRAFGDGRWEVAFRFRSSQDARDFSGALDALSLSDDKPQENA
jgi:hypothetical protein